MASRNSPDSIEGIVLSLPPQFTPRLKFGAVAVLLLLAVGVAVLVSALGPRGSEQPVQSIRGAAETAADAELPEMGATIYVHLLGAVVHPGLYGLPENSRAIDAIASAGGYSENADRAWLNLARFLSDGEQLYIPELGEGPPAGAGAVGAVGGKVNINTADAAALETLPRVGPAMAARIIAWREQNGRFSAIDELSSVSGVGEKTLAALKDLITV